MKIFIYLFIFLFPQFVLADAGPNIRRTKAPCVAVFTGLDKLNDYSFFLSEKDYNNNSTILNNNDTARIYYTSGEKWRNGPVTVLVQDKRTQQNIDSFTLSAEGYNLAIHFTGVENNKIKYTVDKTKSEYPYQLFNNDSKPDPALAKRNRYILIALSAIGFLILVFMLFKRSNNSDKTIIA